MTHALSREVDDTLKQRELLVRGLVHANAENNDDEVARLEYLLETIDGLLTIVTCSEARH